MTGINVGNQSEPDIEKLIDFYLHTIKNWKLNPCCQCLPLSKELLNLVKTMIANIENVLNEVVEEVVRVEQAVIV